MTIEVIKMKIVMIIKMKIKMKKMKRLCIGMAEKMKVH